MPKPLASYRTQPSATDRHFVNQEDHQLTATLVSIAGVVVDVMGDSSDDADDSQATLSSAARRSTQSDFRIDNSALSPTRTFDNQRIADAKACDSSATEMFFPRQHEVQEQSGLIATVFEGNFKILNPNRPLGRGGMGIVFEWEQMVPGTYRRAG